MNENWCLNITALIKKKQRIHIKNVDDNDVRGDVFLLVTDGIKDKIINF